MNEEKLFFHMAVMFYNSKTENVKRDNVIKKIIENVLVKNNNKLFTCIELSVEINNISGMLVVEDEISTIVTNRKNGNFDIDYTSGEIKVNLKQRRFEYLKELNKKNISYYIDEFVKLKGYSETSRDIINRFIYSYYCKNINDLNNIINGNINVQVSSDELLQEELDIVREFIEWDNDEKNKMFHALANSALEYLLVAGNSELIHRKDIKSAFVGKRIYIDTNILFYCLGINGDVFEKTNRALLKKCIECKEELVISYYTNAELKATIEHFIREIERLDTPLIHNYKVSNWIVNKDIYSYYLAWCRGQKNLTEPKYFKKYLERKYDELVKEFEIEIERVKPFEEEELLKDEKFQCYNQEIICNSETNYDARNIFLVESKRGNLETNLQNANTIFLSADKVLQNWDNMREKNIPVVIAPNLWLLLLSRLVSRSDEDFKCFISFVNMINYEPIISNKEYFEVVKVINEIVEDVKKQENILEIMIEEEFAFLENNGEKRSPEFIAEKTTEETNRIVTERIDILERDLNMTQNKLQKTEDTLREVLVSQEQINEQVRQKAYDDAEKITKEKENVENENAKLKKKILWIKRGICIVLILLISIPYICELCNVFICKAQNPISWQIVNKLLNKTVCEPENINGYYLSGMYIFGGLIATIIDVVLIRKLWINKE